MSDKELALIGKELDVNVHDLRSEVAAS